MRVTVQDIAQAAGVSVATVSRTLRGLPKRQTAAQKRILQLSREMGYGRLKGKSGIARTAVGQILFLDSAMSDQTLASEVHHGPMFNAIRDIVEPSGYTLMISSVTGNKPLPPALQSPEMLSGILVHGPFSPDFFNAHLRGVPVVGMQYVDPRLPCSWVAIDNHAAMHQAVEHLYRMGHRRIAFLANEVERFHSKQRHRSYQDAMTAYGLPIHPTWHVVWQRPFVNGILPREMALPDFTPQLAPALADKAHAPTAIITSGDWQAQATIDALTQFGLRVPEDVSVTGMGHALSDPLARSRQTLTTLDDRLDAVAAAAAKALIQQIENVSDDHTVLYIRPQLIHGQTTAPTTTG